MKLQSGKLLLFLSILQENPNRYYRVNGILKGEYGLDDLFIDKEHAQKAVREAVWLYNYERPHSALNYGKPAEIYFEKIDVK
ncbi:MAG: hypothetical protein D3904_06600 [Candidatus Electrothrix sp. EH2]|nr:hypothetical protein [Candidatus Electrothrix sp. EH2]